MDDSDRFLVEEAASFLESYRVKDITTKTIRAREKQLERFSEWLDSTGRDLLDCDFEDIEAYIGYLKRDEGLAHKTAKAHISAVSILFKRLNKKGTVDEDPVSKLDLTDYLSYNESYQAKVLKDEDEVVWLSRSEVRQLTEHVNAPRLRNQLIIQFLFQTGVRRQEACDIELNDLDRQERTVKIRGKGDKNRTVYYNRKLNLLLDAWLDQGYRSSSPYASESDYLFLSHESGQLRGTTISDIVSQAAENADMQTELYTDSIGRPRRRVTAHALRHSFAVEYLRQGGTIGRLKKIMGHASVETTEKYAEIVDEDVREEYNQLDIGNDLEYTHSDERCELCNSQANLQEHHYSYDPPETMDVCSPCHAQIHHSERYVQLRPEMSKPEAEEQGLIE
jgi:integrase/recombinase XerD